MCGPNNGVYEEVDKMVLKKETQNNVCESPLNTDKKKAVYINMQNRV